MQPTLFSTQQWTVSKLTFYIRKLLEENEVLQDLWVQGEISNLSRPASGHVYFTLKDASAALKCVMWKTSVARLRLGLQDGMAVEVHGRIGLYEMSGQYQLYADQIRPVGEGALYQEFMRLRAMLEAEGLFDAERKRLIPVFPKKIGIVTSATGAALRDMLNTLRRRLPLVEVILTPSPVQGIEAPPALVRALQSLVLQSPDVILLARGGGSIEDLWAFNDERVVRAVAMSPVPVILAPSPVQGIEAPPALVRALQSLVLQSPDIILLARGGGSIEDLWAFNDERVVRAVAMSPVPVICGVGHETDFTLCDFAADLRAPTPTAAAELATPLTMVDLRAGLLNYRTRLVSATLTLLAEQKTWLSSLVSQLRYVSPDRRIQSERQRVDELTRRAHSSLLHHLQLETAHIKGMQRRLEALNPLAVLRRGYAVVTRRDDGSVVSRVAQASEEMNVRVSDGEFEVNRQTPVMLSDRRK